MPVKYGKLCRKRQSKRLLTATRNASERYSKDLNVPILDLEEEFDIVARGQNYKQELTKWLEKFQRAIDESGVSDGIGKSGLQITQNIQKFIDSYPSDWSGWDGTRRLISKLEEQCSDVLRARRESTKNVEMGRKIDSILRASYRLENILCPHYQELYTGPTILLTGEGGVGKTHFLCSYAEKLFSNNRNVLLFLADEIIDNDPVLGIARILGYKTKRTFVNTLKHLTGRGHSLIFIVDALNEQPNVDWKKLDELTDIPKVSLIVSVRSGFESMAKIDGWDMKRVEHHGFSSEELEWQAMKKYFSAYGIKDLADTPLLYNEFRVPLFLKIFCSSYSSNIAKKPRGNIMTNVFEQYTVKVTKKVSKELRIKIGEKDLWKNIIKEVAKLIYSDRAHRTSGQKLRMVIKRSSLGASPNKVIRLLCRYGLLRKMRHYTKRYRPWGFDYSFVYHKFSDHLIIRYFLDSLEDCDENQAQQELKKFINKAISDGDQGLLEALMIQYPERYDGSEAISLMRKSQRKLNIVFESLLNSLVWRNPEVSSRVNMDIIEISRYFRGRKYSEDEFNRLIDYLVTVSIVPTHPFNVLFLHKILLDKKMPERDKFWQQYIYYWATSYGGTFERLCGWAFSQFGKESKRNQRRLSCITLAWFIASTNKSVRDRASYAIIRLLDGNIGEAIRLIEIFKRCDDAYILERLYLIAYGLALNENGQKRQFLNLVKYASMKVLRNTSRMPNITIDQCARDIIELYQDRYGELDLELLQACQPPYSCYNHEISPRTAKEIKSEYEKDERFFSLIHSVLYPEGFPGDFGNYIVGYKFSNVSSRRLTSKAPSPETASSDTELQYDAVMARNWIFENVLELGWSPELHSSFDRYAARGDELRGSGGLFKTERIGKKYQWISLDELMAIESSKYYLLDGFYNRTLKTYSNTNDFNRRDFDPTVPSEWLIDSSGNFCQEIDSSTGDISNEPRNFKIKAGIPELRQFIELERKGEKVYALLYYDNHSFTDANGEKWYQGTFIDACLVNMKDIDDIISQYERDGAYSMRDKVLARTLYEEVFLGEYLKNTPVFRTSIYAGQDEQPDSLSAPMNHTVEIYSGESFNLDEVLTRRIMFPSRPLIEGLKIESNGYADFSNKDRAQIFTTEARNGSSILVINEKAIKKLLKSGYTIAFLYNGDEIQVDENSTPQLKKEYEGIAYINQADKLICAQRLRH